MPCEIAPRSKGRARKLLGSLAATMLSALVLASPSLAHDVDANGDGMRCSFTVGTLVQPRTMRVVTVDDKLILHGARGTCAGPFEIVGPTAS
jgi:hypothetical protein